MTNWTPGVKADATKVVEALRSRYANPTKNSIRKWVIAELKAAEPTLVLDLWGGGLSAAEMSAAGLNVLSVDDGRDAKDLGYSAARTKRALALRGEADGYRTGWPTGDASLLRYLAECDAAWLDFMGHPCHTTERVLDACKGKKIVVLTLMASRNAGHEGMSVESYILEFRGLIEGRSGLRVRTVRKYRRPDGQWVLVFVAIATLREAQAARRAAHYATHREEIRARARDYQAVSRMVPRVHARQAAWRATHREEIRAASAAYRAAHLEEARAYDAAHREERNAHRRAGHALKRAERLNAGGDA